MHKNRKILKYKKYKKKAYYRVNMAEKIKKRNYYEESINALVYYMEENEKNPSERLWNHYAVYQSYLSSKTIGYISGMGFNTFCRKIRKEINKKKRQN